MAAKKTAKKKVAKKAAKKTAQVKLPKVNIVEEERCSSCRYSKVISAESPKIICRRYPCTAGVKTQPSMPVSGWCGEYEAK